MSIYRLIFLVLVAFTGVVYADNDCTQGDDFTDCESASQNGYDYWIKLKRLFDIDLGTWDGADMAEGRTEAAADGRLFCVLAYRENSSGARNRRIQDFRVDISGSSQGGQFVLESLSDNSTIPITLTLVGADGDAFDGFQQVLQENQSIDFDPSNNYAQCKNNELLIRAEVSRNDILQYARVNQYSGIYTLTATRTQSVSLSVNVQFQVDLEVVPLVQISGLEDMLVTHTTGNDVNQEQDFCVYTFGTSGFQVKGESHNGDGAFSLKSGNQTIEYGVSVGRGNGNGNYVDLVEGGDYQSHSSWRGEDSLLCADGENMKLKVTILDSEISAKEAGVYQDNVQLTVAPL